jgi:hypothetical protein
MKIARSHMTKVSAALLAAVLTLIALPAALAQDAGTRPFRLGFTPFPYAISNEAVAWTYARIAEDADLMVHHFDNGVPWPEALTGAPATEAFHPNLLADWTFRRAQVPAGHELLLTLTPIDLARTGLALYRGEGEDQPLPAPFAGYAFDHPDVIAAFTHYAREAIRFFQPDYVLIGIEVNLLIRNAPDQWPAYATLHREAYTALRSDFPDLPIMVSMTGIDLLDGYTDADPAGQQQALADLEPYTDYLALSIYPYMTRYMTTPVPDDFFDRIRALTDLPLAISETGYPAQTFAADVGGTRLTFESDAQRQLAWIDRVLAAAMRDEYRFVVNFVLRDYDALWEAIGAREDFTIAWRDTGLYDEDGGERPALLRWREALAMPLAEPAG